jgi:gamma-glutamylcyclotransferase
MLYFAYGSNMCVGRLRQRVPSAIFARIAKLMGHSFRFHKRSSDDSAKSDAFETGDPSDFVWGIIFDIDEREKPALDRAEGLGFGYREKTETLFDEGRQEHRAFLYVADTNSIDNTLRPYSWYKRFVVDGARQHALPEEYVNGIAAMPDVDDADQARDRRERSIVC